MQLERGQKHALEQGFPNTSHVSPPGARFVFLR